MVGFSEFCLSEGFAESWPDTLLQEQFVRFLALLNRSPEMKFSVQSPVLESFFAPVAKPVAKMLLDTRFCLARRGTLRAGPF